MQENNQVRYSYKGMSLYDYCKGKKELNYGSIRQYVYRQKKKNPDLTDEELIQQYLNKKHKGKYTYYYVGIPLKQYCSEHDINYQNVMSYIQYHKNDEKFSGLDEDEFVEAIMEQYEPFKPKYLYKGMLLTEYCRNNKMPYISIVSYVKRKLANDSTKSIDDLIDEGIKTINRYGIIYYYNGIPLKDYAEENDLNYSSLRGAIIKKRASCNKQVQDIVNECVLGYQKFSIKYRYHGISLRQYCLNIGLSYNTVIEKYINEYQDRKDISTAIEEILDYYMTNPPSTTKYYFNNQTLARFCDSNGYSYSNILRRIRRMQNNNAENAELDDEQIVEMAVKKYEDRLYINKINKIFKKLEKLGINDEEELRNICEFLKIDFENVTDFIHMDFSYKQAINLIWYFSDKKNENDDKIITDKKLNSLFSLIDSLKTPQDKEYRNIELYDLIGIYKSGLYDSRNEIVIKQKNYIHHIMYSLCKSYQIEINRNNFEDFESELKLYLIKIIDRVSLNVYGQIIKYMDITIKGAFRTFLRQYKEQNEIWSLDDANFGADKENKNGKSRIDFIADSKNQYSDSEGLSFSSNMMKVLSTLSDNDLSYILLKFQENYTDFELAEHFHMNIDDLREKEVQIFSQLKENQSIQVLKKTKK